ncbi:NAD-binding protein [Schizopora paradoxa]|uniref:NAD-binding protein n=1 Tax=Schizopora paradoxa TaxID=27342 RepID=A0A0H2S8U1_9AGAM|nr:NAD-binding protein [Schizopora paradoxa]
MQTQRVQKVVLCGAGFLGNYIAKALMNDVASYQAIRRVQLTSRNPEKTYAKLKQEVPSDRLLAPVEADITNPQSLDSAFKGADVVVSLVGILQGSPKQFETIQWHGAENVAAAAKSAGAKLIHISAIGADKDSNIPYARTKALGEEAVTSICKDATIIRPSIVFGPGDGFFARFAALSKFLPFMPVFGGGSTKFQPVYAGDVAKAVEIASRTFDKEAMTSTNGKIIEAGGPDIFTYRDIMNLVLTHTKRTRPILSLPFFVGKMQGLVLEQLPTNLFTLTRDQVEQLKIDNVASSNPPQNHVMLVDLLRKFGDEPPMSAHKILPSYL